ncbi:MAG: hypothetical protein HY292_10780 [Planctomycetes bacterium]|nr:hypothetical protein [Planctomycetota bacterium]
MRTAMVAFLAIGSALLAAPQEKSPPKAPASFDTQVDAERVCNDEVFDEQFRNAKERLFQQHPAAWVAIVGGELLETFDSMSACVEAADHKHPNARHRYLFRIGEEGDTRLQGPAPIEPEQPRDCIGCGFKALFRPSEMISPSTQTLTWTRNGKSTTRRWFNENYTEIEVADPFGAKPKSIRVVDSGSFTGVLGLCRETAAGFDLARFEIPGRAFIKGSMTGDTFECRRARARIRVPEIDIDEAIPVVIWEGITTLVR